MNEKEQDILIDRLIYRLKTEGYIHKQKKAKLTADEMSSQKDVYIKNEQTLKEMIEKQTFLKPEYDFPEDGPFDYRYIINHGKGLTPTKAMLAMYWREKTSYTKLGKVYSFPTRGMAGTMITRETKEARQLAESIEIKDFRRLVSLVDDKYQEMFKARGGFEWKLKNLVENVDLLIQ